MWMCFFNQVLKTHPVLFLLLAAQQHKVKSNLPENIFYHNNLISNLGTNEMNTVQMCTFTQSILSTFESKMGESLLTKNITEAEHVLQMLFHVLPHKTCNFIKLHSCRKIMLAVKPHSPVLHTLIMVSTINILIQSFQNKSMFLIMKIFWNFLNCTSFSLANVKVTVRCKQWLN